MRCIWNSMGYSTEASITRCFLHNCWYLTGAVIEITMGLVMLGNSCSPVTRLERLSDSMGVITGHHGAAGSPRFYQRMVSHHFPVGAATAGRDLHHSLLFRRNTPGSNLPPNHFWEHLSSTIAWHDWKQKKWLSRISTHPEEVPNNF